MCIEYRHNIYYNIYSRRHTHIVMASNDVFCARVPRSSIIILYDIFHARRRNKSDGDKRNKNKNKNTQAVS